MIISHGYPVRVLATAIHSSNLESSMSLEQVVLVWLLMTLQGCRRFYESAFIMKHSKSTMPITIYALGIAYYLVTNVAIWIEGTGWWIMLSNDRPKY
jgi:3-oxo-5-alpha-steroid 4-dehydrogenase 3